MATIKTKPIYRFYEFEPALPFRMERRDDGSEVLVQPGYAFVNETVPGDRYSLKRSAMQAATDGYREWEALREMHQPMAAGFVPKLEWDERGAYIEAHVVDPVAQQKVRTGTYKGFSVGVTPTLVNRANEVESCEWVEISLVDRPKDAHAVFTLARVENLDPDAEVEVEVVDDVATSPGTMATSPTPETLAPASPAAAAPDPEAAAAPDPTEISVTPSLTPATSADPSVEASPSVALQSAQAPAEGVSSHTEEERAALLASGLPEGMLAGVTVTTSEERALGSPVVPIRENLAGGPTPTMDDVLGDRFPEGYRVEQAANGKWCAYGGGVKLGEFDTEAEARARVTEARDAMKGSDDPTPGYRAANVTPERVEAITAELTGILARATALQQELAGEAPAAPAAVDVPLSETHEDGEARLAHIQAAAVEEPPPAAPETVSRADVRDDPSELQRLEASNADLLQRLAAHQETVTRLAASEAEVQRLRSLPLDKEKPPIRFAHALDRRFLANLGQEGEQQIAVLRADYEAAKKEAVEHRGGDRDKLNRATERMILRASQLAEHGILV